MARSSAIAIAAALVVGGTASSQSSLIVGGPDSTRMPSDPAGAWDGARLASLRLALEDDLNFGPTTGTTGISVDTKDLSTVDAASLSTLDCFVSPAWPDADISAAEVDAVVRWFLCGGHLVLIDPDGSTDAIGEALDLRTFGSTGSVSNGLAPLFEGPFGSASDVDHGVSGAPTGRLREPRVRSTRGHVAAVNADGQVTAAYWNPGAYGGRSGFLLIVTDRSSISDLGASYSPLDDNGRFALNAFAMLAAREALYVLGGPSAAHQPSAGARAWDGGVDLAAFRSALEDTDLFGEYGTVPQRIITQDIDSFDANTLVGLDGFVCPAWDEADIPAGAADALFDFFHAGGDLLQLNDSATEDPMGDRLSVPVAGSSAGTDSSGPAPLFDGAFGTATGVSQSGASGRLDPAAVSAAGGTVAATNLGGEITGAYWCEGDYAAGSGNMVIVTDLDMATTPGASYDPSDDNGVFCLNAAAFLSTHRILRVAGPHESIQASSGMFEWHDGPAMRAVRAALEDRTHFSPSAPGRALVSTHNVSRIEPAVLARYDVFVAALWLDSETSAGHLQAVLDYHACGGNLLLLSSTTAADLVAETLGMTMVSGSSADVNGTGPLFDGPFGAADDVTRLGSGAQLRFADVNQQNGTAAGFGEFTEICVATWGPGQYATGAGRIVIGTDHTMISGLSASYSPPDDNGRFALNAFSFLLDQTTNGSVHYGHGCPGTGDLSPTLTLEGTPDVDHPVSLRIRNGVGNGLVFLWLGTEGRGNADFNGCPFLVAGSPQRLKVVLSGASGVAGAGHQLLSGFIPDNAALSGLQINTQVFIRDSGSSAGVSATDGVEFVIGGS